MRTYTSTSYIRPQEWDLYSSKLVKYHNYNIISQKEKNVLGQEVDYFEYSVDEYTNEEYYLQQIEFLTHKVEELQEQINK